MTPGARRAVNVVMSWLAAAAAGLVVLPLLLILAFLLWQGVSAVNVDFFTHLPRPVGEVGGGMANAIVGTLILLVLAAALGLPVGILGGLYLAESRDRRLPWIARFLADVLNGVPSIVIGIFAYTIIVLPTARAGIITGVMVALARVAGETAPLLFTAFGNRFWHQGLDQPIAALPLQIFAYAIAPYDDWHRQAWAGALVLIGLVFVVSFAARVVTSGRFTGVR